VSLSTKITRSGNILPSLVELKVQSVSSATGLTRVNITGILCGVARRISKLICPDLKQNKENHTTTLLNALTVGEIIKLTSIFAYFGSIDLTENCM